MSDLTGWLALIIVAYSAWLVASHFGMWERFRDGDW